LVELDATDLFDGGDGYDTAALMGYDPDDSCIDVEAFGFSDCDHIRRARANRRSGFGSEPRAA
jgi:hypothetical protein